MFLLLSVMRNFKGALKVYCASGVIHFLQQMKINYSEWEEKFSIVLAIEERLDDEL